MLLGEEKGKGIIVRNSNKSNIFWQPICAFNLNKVYHAAKRKKTGFILITPACFMCWSSRTVFILYPHNMQTWLLSLLQHVNAKEHLLPTATGMLLLLIIHICHWDKMEYCVYMKYHTANSPFFLELTIYSDYTSRSVLSVCLFFWQTIRLYLSLPYSLEVCGRESAVSSLLQTNTSIRKAAHTHKKKTEMWNSKEGLHHQVIHCWDPILWPLSVLRQDRRTLYRERGYLVQMVKELHCFTFELKLTKP